MCILTLFRNNQGFILTHNRDEDFNRKPSRTLKTKKLNQQEITFPMDIASGGSWIMTCGKWTTAILNGGFEKHKRNPPYKHSRGQFPFLIAEFNNVDDYIESLDLINIEPFTQIIIDNRTHDAFHFVWDGKEKTQVLIEDNFFNICSATLYTKDKKAYVKSTFDRLEILNSANLAQKHKDLIWEYNKALPLIRTTSIVQVIKNQDEKVMNYKTFNI